MTGNVTGLVWQDDEEAKTVKRLWVTQSNYDAEKYFDTSGDTATTYCATLTLADYTDWRLPTRKELQGLVDYGQDNSTFINTASYAYWSSTTHAYSSNSNRAWIVSFVSGSQSYNYKDTRFLIFK